jgi:hypothetical protein
MWKWQAQFRIAIQVLADQALEKIGAQLDVEVLLVGLTERPGAPHPICAEPETGALQPAHLAGVRDRATHLYEQQLDPKMFYSDPDVEAGQDAYLRNATMYSEKLLMPYGCPSLGLMTSVAAIKISFAQRQNSSAGGASTGPRISTCRRHTMHSTTSRHVLMKERGQSGGCYLWRRGTRT